MQNEIKDIQKRPIIVTIICWYLIIGGLAIPVMIYMAINNPQVVEMIQKGSTLPMAVHYALMGLSVVVNLWAAIGMLKGKIQARTVYVTYSIVAYSLTILTSNMKETLIGGVLMTIVIIGLLYIPSANRYFTSSDA